MTKEKKLFHREETFRLGHFIEGNGRDVERFTIAALPASTFE
jgi:hypothetical protein